MTLLARNVGSNMYSIIDYDEYESFTDDEVDVITLLEDMEDYLSTSDLFNSLYELIK